MPNLTNAERASRAETAVLAYIDAVGDPRDSNGIDTWTADLLCDLRHLADKVGFQFDPAAGAMNHEAERDGGDGDQPGEFEPQFNGWYVEKPAAE